MRMNKDDYVYYQRSPKNESKNVGANGVFMVPTQTIRFVMKSGIQNGRRWEGKLMVNNNDANQTKKSWNISINGTTLTPVETSSISWENRV